MKTFIKFYASSCSVFDKIWLAQRTWNIEVDYLRINNSIFCNTSFKITYLFNVSTTRATFSIESRLCNRLKFMIIQPGTVYKSRVNIQFEHVYAILARVLYLVYKIKLWIRSIENKTKILLVIIKSFTNSKKGLTNFNHFIRTTLYNVD